MVVYLIMLAGSVFFASLAAKIRYVDEFKREYRICAVLSVLPFFIVSAVRFEVGTDWGIYDEYFYAINTGTNSFKEPLFNLLNRIIYLFTDNSQWLFVAVSALCLTFTFMAIYNQSKYIPFSIIIYFISTVYFNSMNQMRQAVAMSIFLFATKYLWSRNWKKYFLWILIAACMHISALIYFPVYFLYGWKANLKKHIILSGVIIVGMPILKVILTKLISLTPYAWYLESLYTTNDFLLAGFLISLVLLLIHEYYNYTENQDEDRQFSFMVNMQWLGVISLLCTGFIPQVSRISVALEIISIITYPKLVLFERGRNRRIILYGLIISIFVVKLLYNVYVCGFYDAIPYQTIFSKM